MNISTILTALEVEKTKVAKETLEKPGQGDVFAYGRAVGVYAGLSRAQALIENTLRDEAKRTENL
ncbi:hypothetical protein [Caulobacter phage KcrB]|nr:hypothetical protein RW_GP091c [Caulobacter phage RW]WCA46395.1 hypothetical protein [Caulobacter phage KcrB]WCD56330.1 hypothetical protein [Caulobacter phage RLK]WNV48122.1 hypothetical protein GB2A_gp090c [Caulobacter phage GB2A]